METATPLGMLSMSMISSATLLGHLMRMCLAALGVSWSTSSMPTTCGCRSSLGLRMTCHGLARAASGRCSCNTSVQRPLHKDAAPSWRQNPLAVELAPWQKPLAEAPSRPQQRWKTCTSPKAAERRWPAAATAVQRASTPPASSESRSGRSSRLQSQGARSRSRRSKAAGAFSWATLKRDFPLSPSPRRRPASCTTAGSGVPASSFGSSACPGNSAASLG
mmetsp:Transcript_30409/g.87148  ORF Transcript_30409/g.87148 Transcript_30409/m.87148 type:complete len:220 (-) Transcript_30409:340-999(-)